MLLPVKQFVERKGWIFFWMSLLSFGLRGGREKLANAGHEIILLVVGWLFVVFDGLEFHEGGSGELEHQAVNIAAFSSHLDLLIYNKN